MTTKLEKIAIDKIFIASSFNIRENFGASESQDLEESIQSTQGNIQPILVLKKDDKYQLISGERRYNAIKKSGMTEILCIVYNTLTEDQMVKLMFNENMGRKNLTWLEELKGIKRLKALGCDISIEFLARHKNISGYKAWSLLEALKAIDEFPELVNEKTRKLVLERYKELNKLDFEKLEAVKDQKITIKEALTSESTRRTLNSGKLVIGELKEEVDHYKEKFKNIYKTVSVLDKQERIENGVWLKEEVKQMIESARGCATFGLLKTDDKECQDCAKSSTSLYSKCEFFFEEFKNK